MRTSHLIDTSVYLVLLRVPKHYTEQQLAETSKQFEEFYKNNDILLLPFGTVVETGSHIADSLNGRRHGLIEKFVDDVEKALMGVRPYKICGIPKGDLADEEILQWVKTYKEYAQSGLSFVDSMCVDIYNEYVKIFPYDHVRIWTYDQDHLGGYDNKPNANR